MFTAGDEATARETAWYRCELTWARQADAAEVTYELACAAKVAMEIHDVEISTVQRRMKSGAERRLDKGARGARSGARTVTLATDAPTIEAAKAQLSAGERFVVTGAIRAEQGGVELPSLQASARFSYPESEADETAKAANPEKYGLWLLKQVY
jgi:hypothetical protein